MIEMNEFSSEEEVGNLMTLLISELKLYCARASFKSGEPTIIDKLNDLVEKEFLSKSKNKIKNNQEFLMTSLESMIPLLVRQERHNYILFDDFVLRAMTDEGFEKICTRQEVGDEKYKKIIYHIYKRLLPFDIWEEFLKFSELSAKLCYNNYIIVLLRNMKCAEYIESSDSDSEVDRILKYRLVKIEDSKKVQYCINVPAEHLFLGQCSCLHPNVQDAKIESIFDKINKNNKSRATTDKLHKITDCSERSLENNSESVYSTCPMAFFLAARSSLISKESKFNKLSIVEVFFFDYCCKTLNNSITIKKVICVTKANTGKFCIYQVEPDASYLIKNFYKKEIVEVETQSEVDRMIHSVYHNYLNECSSQITVFHKPNSDDYQKIFSITFAEGTKTSLFSEFDTSFEEKTTEQKKENPHVSLVHTLYAEVLENSLQSKEMISKETVKSKCVPFQKVYGWLKGKEKYNFELKLGVEHLRECKGKEHILLNFDGNMIEEGKHEKRMLEDDSATQQSSKKKKTEDSMEVDENLSYHNVNREKTPDYINIVCNSDSMDVDENLSKDNLSDKNTLNNHDNAACGSSILEHLQDPVDIFESRSSIFRHLQDSVDIFESKSDVQQREIKHQTPLDRILDRCLNNKKQLTQDWCS